MGNFDGLPEEMRLKILTRLPTQSILKCKSVSKSWRQIVHHPSFPQVHLTHLHDSDSGKLGFILFHKSGLVEYTEYDDESYSHDIPPFSKARRFNLISPFTDYEILDSCNGLICFNAVRSDYCGPSFICNPVTRECVTLPKLEGKELLTGFGYSSSTNEYKVVGISQRDPQFGIVQVYTLGSGTGWRNDGKMDYNAIFVGRRGVIANGALHWLCIRGIIVAFDLASEKFRKIPSPACIPESGQFYSLVVLGDCLCAISYNENGTWFMTWKKEYRLSNQIPFASTKNGGLLCCFLGGTRGNIYHTNPKDSSTKLLERFGMSVCLVIPHKNTLI
ncbi:F-box protein At3g07870-like [Papaver somniferum]|uniref:F-box protein At3g07870-like n=1 Tax=Papaver somniferum TaxID=3469 RepID=UPI000E6FB7F0|nr:F-box protein At3g07870-like [Papaver somniferum]XP_026405417.1 F-box protein At3g07870-like [Papaver somniferum]XP_026405418.1 F-box protein At3g07870-like [Papaver somniferum]XP_026405419.1 F-box protein At3g07870-like [Papaver somniferum]